MIMKSGGPWNLRGLRPEVREAARAAARRCGQSVGEWLNSVIEVVDEEDGEYARAAGFDRFPDDGSRQIVGSDDWRHRDTHVDDREANAQLRQHSRADDPEYDRRYHDAGQDDRETNDYRGQHSRAEDLERNRRYHAADQDERGANGQRRQDLGAQERRQGRPYYDRDWGDREAQEREPESRYRGCDCNERQGDRELRNGQAMTEIKARQRELDTIKRGRGGYGSDRPPA